MIITPEIKSLLQFSIQSSINAYCRPQELGAIDYSIYDTYKIFVRKTEMDILPLNGSKETIRKVEGIVSRTGDRLEITFQGSTGFMDWIHNFKFLKENDQYRKPKEIINNITGTVENVKVHEGFSEQAKLVFDVVEDALLSYRKEMKGKEMNILITGHSLGGALANRVAYEVCDRMPEFASSLTVIPHASPRVGNDVFAKALPESVKFYLRTVFETDIVTRVPFEVLGYRHAEPSIILGKTKRKWYERIIHPIDENIGSAKDHYPQNYRDAIAKLKV